MLHTLGIYSKKTENGVHEVHYMTEAEKNFQKKINEDKCSRTKTEKRDEDEVKWQRYV